MEALAQASFGHTNTQVKGSDLLYNPSSKTWDFCSLISLDSLLRRLASAKATLNSKLSEKLLLSLLLLFDLFTLMFFTSVIIDSLIGSVLSFTSFLHSFEVVVVVIRYKS